MGVKTIKLLWAAEYSMFPHLYSIQCFSLDDLVIGDEKGGDQ